VEVGYSLVISVESKFVNITILRLNQEAEVILLLNDSVTDEKDGALFRDAGTARDNGANLIVTRSTIHDPIFTTDQDTRWTVSTTRDGNEHVGSIITAFGPFTDDVVQTEVQLIVCEVLREGHALLVLHRRWVICLAVVHLNHSEDRIIVADIDAEDVVNDVLGTVSLKRGGDCKTSTTIAVEHIHELIFLDGGCHAGTSLRISCNILSWNDATTARFAVGLLVHTVRGGEEKQLSRQKLDDKLGRGSLTD